LADFKYEKRNFPSRFTASGGTQGAARIFPFLDAKGENACNSLRTRLNCINIGGS
jgi:hypothetical protein